MANALPKIRELLETKLASISGLPDVAWENVKYEPTTGTPFIKPTVVPTIRKPACLGASPQQYYQGLFQIVCFVPNNRGPSELDDLVDLIITNFDATSIISDTDLSIQIRRTEHGQGITESPWHKATISISWFTYV